MSSPIQTGRTLATLSHSLIHGSMHSFLHLRPLSTPLLFPVSSSPQPRLPVHLSHSGSLLRWPFSHSVRLPGRPTPKASPAKPNLIQILSPSDSESPSRLLSSCHKGKNPQYIFKGLKPSGGSFPLSFLPLSFGTRILTPLTMELWPDSSLFLPFFRQTTCIPLDPSERPSD